MAGTVVLLVIAVGSTAFDGAKEGALFNDIAQELQSAFRLARVLARHGARARRSSSAWSVAIVIVGAIWALGFAGMPMPASVPDRRALARAFAHTLIPIAAGYLVAHYFSLLAYNGQDLWRLANDPLGNGSDLFGGADGRDRLRRRLGDRHLVRPGRARSSSATSPRSCWRTTARSRSTVRPRGDPLADRHAGADGGLHVPRHVAALGGAEA